MFKAKKFDKCKILLKKFDIYSKIFFRDVGNFFRHLCELVLRHQMRVSNYFVNSFYSVFYTIVVHIFNKLDPSYYWSFFFRSRLVDMAKELEEDDRNKKKETATAVQESKGL